MAKAERQQLGRLLRGNAILLGLLGLLLVASGHWPAATAVLLLALLSVLYRPPRSGSQRPLDRWAAWLSAALVTTIALAGLWMGPPALGYWIYLVPLMLFSVWRVGGATLLLTAFLVVLLGSLVLVEAGAERHQWIPMVLLVSALAGVFVYLREFKVRQLAPLRRTDTLTRASMREHLDTDLHKEIQRSEREGTALSVVHLALDPIADKRLPGADRSAILHQMGRSLHENLRDFDNYYRIEETAFILILPGMPTAEAVGKAEQLRRVMGQLMQRYGLKLTVSAGVAGLNAGDTAESLQQNALEALNRAQQRGGNRTQSFTASSWEGDHD